MVTEEQVIATLKQVFDPEIPIDVWNLGLIYNIGISDSDKSDKQNINITMTLTTPGCQMVQHIKNDVKTKIEAMEEANEATITMTFDPQWNVNMISDDARKKFNL
ncbi:metal-sulfur cluster assembly factor [bacterium]|nr:metal-sulfur cluster assembly factor [bacterium]